MRAKVRPVVQRGVRAAESRNQRVAEAIPRRQGQAAGEEERPQTGPAGDQRQFAQ